MKRCAVLFFGFSQLVFADPKLLPDFKSVQNDLKKCTTCHTATGNSMNSAYPRLAGQQAEYITAELNAFVSRDRNDPAAGTMRPVAAGLNPALIPVLGAYFSMQESKPNKPVADTTLVAQGRNIFLKGSANVPACALCHGTNGLGRGGIPRLAGQFATYVTAQLNAFKNGQRGEAQSMPIIAKAMTPEEMQSVSAYIQGMNPLSLGGQVSGLNGSVILQNNGADNLVLTSNGNFTFATQLEAGARFSVTVLVQPSGQNCTVSNGDGTMADNPVTGINVICQ